MPMGPELQEMYHLYNQELQQRDENEVDANLLLEAKAMMRVIIHIKLRLHVQ